MVKVYRVYDADTGELVQELEEDAGCYGANHGPDNERCGGCTSCLVMQSEHYGCRVEEVEVEKDEHSRN